VLHPARWKYRTQKIAQLGRAISSQLRHVSTIGKKTCQTAIPPPYVLYVLTIWWTIRPTSGWDPLESLGHPNKFQWFSHLSFVTVVTSFTGGQPNFARCWTVSCAGTLYIHFRGLLPHNRILPDAKFTLHSSLALSYIGSVTARHSSSGHQPNFAVLSRGRHLYSTGRPSRWALAHILVHCVTDAYFIKGCLTWLVMMVMFN